MSDTPGPWRRIDGEHYQCCNGFTANVYRSKRFGGYKWRVVHDAGFLTAGHALTLAAAKRAATAALIRHAPMPF